MLYKTKFAQDNRIINLDKCFLIQPRTTDDGNMIIFTPEVDNTSTFCGTIIIYPPNIVMYDNAELVEKEIDEIMKFANGGE